jgi:hypothetical protein
MIKELTEEQLKQMEEYVKRWTEIGLSTELIDREKAVVYSEKLYKFLGRENVPEVIFADGPISAWKEVEKIYNEKIDFVWPYLDGQFWSSYVAWLLYYKNVLKIEITIDTSVIEELVNYGNVYPLEKHCIITERMSLCKRNANGLHCDGSPAVEYRDGTKIWALNGVRVPQWLSETSHQKLDPKKFAEIKNAEVRREFVRKVGIERICLALGTKVMDKQKDYELHEIDLGGETGKWPYLKMLNPSIGVWHMECVDKTCRTVKDAITWRNQSDLEPKILT